MPYTLNWYIKNEIVYLHYSGEVTKDELYESLMENKRMVDNSPREWVHLISDVGDVTKPLSPKDSLDVVREIGASPKGGWTLVLREQSVIIKMSVAFGTSIFKTRTRTFDTLEEAEAFLKEKDANINWDAIDKSVLMT